jgi:RNase_H superfamily
MTLETRDPTSLGRRLDRYRQAMRTGVETADSPVRVDLPGPLSGIPELAARLAAATDGEILRRPHGTVVRCEPPSREIPLDRRRLAQLPGQPPADVPLLCLDTETTGLATAAGTVAFLIGLGWWEHDRFRQVQLLLPDHSDEPALLDVLADLVPLDGWLVTYNGRGFDWPLLVARYRMTRRLAPPHAGHLDLLPIVRRLFRHRLEDARLRTAEMGLLGLHRQGDIDGWQIPARYHSFLRGGAVEPLVDVVRHNDQDVRSLARLLVHLEHGYATEEDRRDAPAGDLAGLARAYAREVRLAEALTCYDGALAAPDRQTPPAPPTRPLLVGPSRVPVIGDEAWWSPTMAPDFGGQQRPVIRDGRPDRTAAFAAPWTTERISIERAHLLRRMGRSEAAAEAWRAMIGGPGRTTIVASVELAKLLEHRLRDPAAALRVASEGLAAADRRARIGRPEPRLTADLQRRIARLRYRLAPVRRAPRA